MVGFRIAAAFPTFEADNGIEAIAQPTIEKLLADPDGQSGEFIFNIINEWYVRMQEPNAHPLLRHLTDNYFVNFVNGRYYFTSPAKKFLSTTDTVISLLEKLKKNHFAVGCTIDFDPPEIAAEAIQDLVKARGHETLIYCRYQKASN